MNTFIFRSNTASHYCMTEKDLHLSLESENTTNIAVVKVKTFLSVIQATVVGQFSENRKVKVSKIKHLIRPNLCKKNYATNCLDISEIKFMVLLGG